MLHRRSCPKLCTESLAKDIQCNRKLNNAAPLTFSTSAIFLLLFLNFDYVFPLSCSSCIFPSCSFFVCLGLHLFSHCSLSSLSLFLSSSFFFVFSLGLMVCFWDKNIIHWVSLINFVWGCVWVVLMWLSPRVTISKRLVVFVIFVLWSLINKCD